MYVIHIQNFKSLELIRKKIKKYFIIIEILFVASPKSEWSQKQISCPVMLRLCTKFH